MTHFLNQTQSYALTTSGESLIKKYSPETKCAYYQDPSLLYQNEDPTLGKINKEHGNQIATHMVAMQLYDLVEFCGEKDSLDTEQIVQTAGMIICRYGHIRITELKYFIFQVQCGRYGSFFGQLTPMKIMEKLDAFEADRKAMYLKHHKSEDDIERERHEEEMKAARARYQKLVSAIPGGAEAVPFCDFMRLGLCRLSDYDALKRIKAKATGGDSAPDPHAESLRMLNELQMGMGLGDQTRQGQQRC